VVIKRLRTVLIVWLALLALLAFFPSLSQTGRDYSLVESSLVDGIMPVFSVFTAVQKTLGSWWTEINFSSQTRHENDRLKKELLHLKMENVRLRELVSENERLRTILQLKSQVPGPSQAAEVVGSGPSPFLQMVYINKGRRDGLVRGMPVINPSGVVGRLEKTSGHYAQVVLLDDPSFAVDCLCQRTRVRGVLTGIPGEGKCQIKYVPRNEDIRPGDIIVTSGLDQLYPKGMILGRVLKVVSQVQGNFLFIEVVPECKLSQLEEVLILQKSPPLPDQEGSQDG
jgi:rod shape-determining protein MreC